ncbi:MAG: hypothetical protein MK212_04300 [Saprospiraceae bacterium]|nr:hypothetical protein [Saprospiraceae bacterium]
MRHLIIQQAFSEIKTVFRSVEEHPNRYNQLKQLFREPMHYQLFAEPILQLEHKRIAWYTNTAGKATKFSDLDKAGQAKAKLLLRRQLNQLEKYISSNYHGSYQQEVYGFFEQCQEIPKEDSIYLIEDAGKSRVILLEWGFVVNVFNPNRGILSRLIPKDKFPLFFKVKYDDGSPATGQRIHFMWNKHPVRMTSNEEAMIAFGEVKIGDQIEAFTIESNEKQNIHHFECDIDKPTCEIILKRTVDAQFSLVDHEGNAVVGKVVKFSYGVNIVELKSDENGEFILADLPNDTSVSTQVADPKFTQTYEVNQENYQFQIQLPAPVLPPEPEPNIVQFFDPKKETIKDLEVLAYPKPENKGDEPAWKANYKTDEEGKFVFEQKPDYNTIIQLDFKYKKRDYTKEFVYKDDEHYYPIYIRRRFVWWWLLLLLLPLLLLIRCSDDLNYVVVDASSRTPIDSAKSVLNYHPTAKDSIPIEKMSDDKGWIYYNLGSRALYERWFYEAPTGEVETTCPCYERDTSTMQEIRSRGDSVFLKPSTYRALEIEVQNTVSKQPVPKAEVVVTIDFRGRSWKFKDSTDLAGKIVLKDLPFCAQVDIAASKEYYRDTSFSNIDAVDLIQDRTKQLVPLAPVLENVTYFVKSLKSKKGLPGATAEMEIKSPSLEMTVSKQIINVNGAADFQLPPKADLVLKGSMSGYYDSTLVSSMPEAQSYSDEQRTVYLRPKTQTICITVKNKTNGTLIKNAKVEVYCDGTLVDTRYTNNKGEAEFPDVNMDCNLEIKAGATTYYSGQIKGSLRDLFPNEDQCQEILLKPRGPQPTPCVPGGARNSDKRPSQLFDLGKPSGQFLFDYYTDTAPDEIIILCQGKQIFHYSGATGLTWRKKWVTFSHPIIEVRVNGSSVWQYKVNCP